MVETSQRAGSSGDLPRPFGDRFVLLKELAAGGAGRVYMALAGGRVCAIKTLRDGSDSDSHAIRRFDDEARLGTQLHHPNLIYVAELGAVGTERFIAMEYVRGRTLRQVWRRCAEWRLPFPVGLALFVVREVLRGLDHIHGLEDQDVVHRDVTPSNVMIGYEGSVKLIDFGLARWRDRGATTVAGQRWARAPYQSPEQRAGGTVDARTDIFACGALLWELLTGREIFEDGGTLSGTLRLEPPSRVTPSIPREVDALVMTALARRPEDRYLTSEIFAEKITRYLSAEHDGARMKAFLTDLFEEEQEFETQQERRLLAAARMAGHRSTQETPARGTAAEPPSRAATPPRGTMAGGPDPVPPQPRRRTISETERLDPDALLDVTGWRDRRRLLGVAGGLVLGLVGGGILIWRGRPPVVASHPRDPGSALADPAAPSASPVAPPFAIQGESLETAVPRRRSGRSVRMARARAELEEAESLYRGDHLQEALGRAQTAVHTGAGVEAHLLLGKIFYQLGRYDDAFGQYTTALEVAPDNDAAIRGRALADARRRR